MYKALNYWVFGGFDGQKSPYEFISWAAEKGLDGVELTVGDALSIDITEEECRKIRAFAAKKTPVCVLWPPVPAGAVIWVLTMKRSARVPSLL